ncbi:AAA family ATPase [Thiospirochaeta perfilievii]|nr:AAA family ATPase [Thiospirochaeta perfilievii]
MRKDNYAYVDKTKDIYNLIKSGKYYFLSRPRRKIHGYGICKMI